MLLPNQDHVIESVVGSDIKHCLTTIAALIFQANAWRTYDVRQ
jgi:hypothetical protein